MNYLHTMRTQALRLSSLFLSGCTALFLTAQIPNGGFEDWSVHDGYSEPTGWLTYNEVPTVGGSSVEAGMPGYPGSFHAVITTRSASGGGLPIQGWLSAGSSPSQAGFPYAQRPAALTGQWQHNIQPGDTGQVLVTFSKWDGSATEMVGQGTLEIIGNIPDWESFSVPITYLSSEAPDTAYIQIVASINFDAPMVGSMIRVDDLAFSGISGIDEPVAGSGLFTLISTAADQIRITTTATGTLQFFDTGGRLVGTHAIHEPRTILPSSGLPSGFLLYRFITGQGKQLASGKWLKE